MCYNVQQKATVKQLVEKFNANFNLPSLYQPKDTVFGFDFPTIPILTSEDITTFQFAQWGLIPHWAKDDAIRKNTLNAKLETIETVASFKDITKNRCILPVTGFYEWKWLDSKGKRKEKYLIQLEEDSLFSLAGLHTSWRNPVNREVIDSFTLLTTEANDIMAEIHNIKKRMPLIMGATQAKEWLTSGTLELNDKLKTTCIQKDSQMRLF